MRYQTEGKMNFTQGYFIMKLPNGYGSVTKLKGNRRKPWMIRKNGKPIGYTRTKREALAMLAEYNKNDWEVGENLTFEEVYHLLEKHVMPQLSEGTQRHYRGKFKLCEPLHDKPYRTLNQIHFRTIINSTSSTPNAKQKMLQFLRAMDKVAYNFDVITKQYTKRIPNIKTEPVNQREPFSEEEIELLWENVDSPNVDLVLILIYTGFRSGEFADLKIENIDLDKGIMRGGNKTKAGKNRIVPIHPRIRPLIEKRIEMAKGETLLNFGGKQLRIHFKTATKKLDLDHIPH